MLLASTLHIRSSINLRLNIHFFCLSVLYYLLPPTQSILTTDYAGSLHPYSNIPYFKHERI
jgi:hypothetical protein